MVIELKASTRRSTYLAGESVKVCISIANVINNTQRYFQNQTSNITSNNSRHPSNQTTDKIESSNTSPSTVTEIETNVQKITETQALKANQADALNVINTSATNCISSIESGQVLRPERVAWAGVYFVPPIHPSIHHPPTFPLFHL